MSSSLSPQNAQRVEELAANGFACTFDAGSEGRVCRIARGDTVVAEAAAPTDDEAAGKALAALDEVDEASRESFPASDAPGWTDAGICPAGRTPHGSQAHMGTPMNPALAVTGVRIAAIPVVMVLLLAGIPGGAWWAAGVYLAAAATVSLDGWLARSRGEVTVAGAFLDPLADKLLVTAALVSLVELGDLTAWPVMIIVTREFAVTGLRLVAANEDLVIPASRLGKAKTLSQNAAILVIMLPVGWAWLDASLLYLALVLTIVSGVYYFLVARRRLFAPKAPARSLSEDS